jgi:hypothetical protein|nr:MAG TPA: minor capsid protein [Bacteriophage sp.]
MFTPTEIEALPSAMEQLYRSLQLNIMSDLTERLKANGEEITSAADWQINRLYELGVSKDEIDSLIQSTLNVSDDEIDRIRDMQETRSFIQARVKNIFLMRKISSCNNL